ncbi:elongation factor Ts [Candidatus Methylospira mobilis]|uniref:Elongation factor Ts n=1 Tax=Candidatus Methylospira mobilis TaxID=1808979 RepID=A0A5Q0BII3_9GAMM|nr:translation elongation factor Ts [Candidatus Methylospira mobilis]QFY41964.1 elongation factor Ts [Candidatus Methylospira mobilis]WNV02954.1 translation elongation factor Ts [Candidatus Methylospira mobilis]
MNISAGMVKELRERTGSGMMECKKALVEAGGDLEAAVEIMRKSGLAKADKKSGRTAAEGLVSIAVSEDNKRAVILETNCETDFVAKNEDLIEFTDQVAQCILNSPVDALDELLATVLPGGAGISIDERRKELIAKLGENINVRRFERFVSEAGINASYLHGVRIGVLVEVAGGDQDLGRDIAMHIAASSPVCVDDSGVPAETIEKEKTIFSAQAETSGKPANIIEKMVEGRIKKFLAEVTLVGQPFVKDPDQTVGALLKSKGASVPRFARYEVGEGIEKEESNFAEEVMAQVRGS